MIFSNKIIGKNINLIILKIFLWLFHSFNLINEILILLILKKLFVFLQIESFGRKPIFYGGARLNKKNEIMKILQILEIFTK